MTNILDLRRVSLEYAFQTCEKPVSVEVILDAAKRFEEYLRGTTVYDQTT